MTEVQGLYGPSSANWYSKLEAEAAINAVKGCVWSMEQITDIPLNNEGHGYLQHILASMARSSEAAAGFRNARTFMFESQASFEALYPLTGKVTQVIRKTGELAKAYPGLIEGAERLHGGVNMLGKIALGEAAGYIDRLVIEANEIIVRAGELQPDHDLIEELAQDISKIY